MSGEILKSSQRNSLVPRRVGWVKFALQLVSVSGVYVAASIPPVLLLGQTSTGVALSAMCSMAAALLVAWLWLRHDRATSVAFDLGAPVSWSHTLRLAALAIAATLAIFAGGAMLADALGMTSPDPSFVLDFVTQSPASYALWVLGVAWFAAGFGEELLWRGFLMDRLLRLPGLRTNILAVLVIQAVLFGLPHIYQGISGVIITGTIGLMLGWVRLLNRGNLWAVIIAHAAVDTIIMTLAYGGELGGFGS